MCSAFGLNFDRAVCFIIIAVCVILMFCRCIKLILTIPLLYLLNPAVYIEDFFLSLAIMSVITLNGKDCFK